MHEPLEVYIGFDSKVPHVTDVCAFSLSRRATIPLRVFALNQSVLREHGLYWRDEDPLASTEFTYSRFLVPALNGYRSRAVFCDNDFLWLSDIADLVEELDPGAGVSCVHHNHEPPETLKMDGQVQTRYPRKNWSSLMVFNCADESVHALTVEAANTGTGKFLHRFEWIADNRIGSLSTGWNWLEGHNERPDEGTPRVVHYTRGGPWLEEWANVEYADLWRTEHAAWETAGSPRIEVATEAFESV